MLSTPCMHFNYRHPHSIPVAYRSIRRLIEEDHVQDPAQYGRDERLYQTQSEMRAESGSRSPKCLPSLSLPKPHPDDIKLISSTT